MPLNKRNRFVLIFFENMPNTIMNKGSAISKSIMTSLIIGFPPAKFKLKEEFGLKSAKRICIRFKIPIIVRIMRTMISLFIFIAFI